MYKSFYSLSRHPFDLTPNPDFLYATAHHNEALAAMYYGVRRHKGFVVVTGEVGTGKTLLLRCLLRQFRNSADIGYAYVSNPLLSPTEFLQFVLADFGMPAFSKNKNEVLFDLSRFLVSREFSNQTSVLIVDEAHSLTNEMLEEIRLLTNLETSEEKLLQVVLVGQPELDEKLDSVCLRQLKQRIALRVSLRMLSEAETKGYIQQRLKVAGLGPSSTTPFSVQAIEAIYRLSSGTPRIINTICENSLIAGYAKRMRVVGPDVVERVAQELGIGKRFSSVGGGDRYDRPVTDRPYAPGIDGKDSRIVEEIPVS